VVDARMIMAVPLGLRLVAVNLDGQAVRRSHDGGYIIPEDLEGVSHCFWRDSGIYMCYHLYVKYRMYAESSETRILTG
jgi:hypothetical protein